MAWKESRYNYWSAVDGRWLLLNGRTGALIAMSGEERDDVREVFAAPDASGADSVMEPLGAAGFLVDASIDEIAQVLDRIGSRVRDDTKLDLVIAPTYACNFRCRYCYVSFTDGTMTRDVEERVSRFLAKSLPRYAEANVAWFGGEPLLALGTVLRVSRAAYDIGRQDALRLMLTTNGYLLTGKTAEQLFHAGIRYLHVTVDGPASTHDSTRVLRNAGPTFDVVWGNFLQVLSRGLPFDVTLRMNADAHNIDSLSALLDSVPATHRPKVHLSVAPVEGQPAAPTPDLHRSINDVIRKALDAGFAYYGARLPLGRHLYCSADRRHALHVAPDGALYKCSPWSKPEAKVGYLTEDGDAVLTPAYERWHSAPNVLERCRACRYLPVCAGGCRVQRLRGVEDATCDQRYVDIDGLVRNYYMSKTPRRGETGGLEC